jgi:hypothetical protein
LLLSAPHHSGLSFVSFFRFLLWIFLMLSATGRYCDHLGGFNKVTLRAKTAFSTISVISTKWSSMR